MDQIVNRAAELLQTAIAYLRHPEVLFQIGLIVVLFLMALMLSKRVEPRLQERARNISKVPELLRVVDAFLQRLEWVFLVVLLALSSLAIAVAPWPANDYLVSNAMILAAAWLTISVASNIIRSRFIARIVAVAGWTLAAITILGINDDVFQILDSVGFNLGSTRFSLLSVLTAISFIALLLWASLAIGNFFDRRIQSIEELTPSLRVLVGKILRIFLIVLAVMIAMQSLNLDLTALTVLSGAIGVGIGFGLQKVVSNFIAGIIILMDQSIKPGDTITLGETFGWIRELRARFVSVITRDGREYLIPNEDFITTQVVNWSFSDKYVRLDVPFGVAYSSDPHEVTRLAIEAAASVDRVDENYNKPVCWMTEFGDSSINFVLRFWIDDPQGGLTNIRGQVLLRLWDTFKANGISIPFPHREVIMKTPVIVATQEG